MTGSEPWAAKAPTGAEAARVSGESASGRGNDCAGGGAWWRVATAG